MAPVRREVGWGGEVSYSSSQLQCCARRGAPVPLLVRDGSYFLWPLKCLHSCVVSFL